MFASRHRCKAGWGTSGDFFRCILNEKSDNAILANLQRPCDYAAESMIQQERLRKRVAKPSP